MVHTHPPGYELLEQRWRAVPQLLAEWITAESAAGSAELHGSRFVVTGIGSSEAHARYLQCLLDHAPAGGVEFRPVSSFYGGQQAEADRDKVLVVISQGLSPNSWLAINARRRFRKLVLLTACTSQGLEARNDPALRAAYEGLVGEGVAFIRFPLENEFDVLIRLVGPLFGYLACYRFARNFAGVDLPAFSADDLLAAFRRSEAAAIALAGEDLNGVAHGLHLIAPPALSLYAQNLCLKFLEGLFWELPRVWDYLDVSHGLLQQLSVVSRPMWLLARSGDDPFLRKSVEEVLKGTKLSYRVIQAELPAYLEIVELEMLFCRLVLELIDLFGIDQRNWPAKGLDYPLYALGKS